MSLADQSSQEEAQRFSVQARTDLQDIQDLRRFVPFQRYFLRRLRQKQEEAFTKFYDTPTGECGHEEREILRRISKEYQSLASLLDTDEGSAKASLDRQS